MAGLPDVAVSAGYAKDQLLLIVQFITLTDQAKKFLLELRAQLPNESFSPDGGFRTYIKAEWSLRAMACLDAFYERRDVFITSEAEEMLEALRREPPPRRDTAGAAPPEEEPPPRKRHRGGRREPRGRPGHNPPPPPPRNGHRDDPVENNPFAVLFLRQDAPEDVAKAVYKLLAAKHHPDRGGDTAKMSAINAAWDDIRKRRNW